MVSPEIEVLAPKLSFAPAFEALRYASWYQPVVLVVVTPELRTPKVSLAQTRNA